MLFQIGEKTKTKNTPTTAVVRVPTKTRRRRRKRKKMKTTINTTAANMSLNLSPILFSPPSLCYNDTYWTAARILVTCTLCLTVVTNVLMLWVTWYAMTTRINPYFFASLAMSDLLSGLFVLPFHLSFVIQSEHADPSHAACTFSGVMFHVLQTISLFSFFALTLDKFISVEYPFHYPTLLTRKVILVRW